jgi:AraC family transcriptional regulator, regulatory protein of adaptative response / methylated-DNA-[protein]-cysteine methyltransferase
MLNETITQPPSDAMANYDPMSDYCRVRQAIQYLTERWNEHPSLDDLSLTLKIGPSQTQKLFKRWCGLSPKEFVQAITLDHAKQLLDGSASVLDTAHEVGLSGSSRLHDLFVTYEAMSPGDYKRRGEGLDIAYGFHPSPFGEALVMATPRGICGLAFVNEDACEERADTLRDMKRRWPKASFHDQPQVTQTMADDIFGRARTANANKDVRIVLIGSDFEVRVWKTLLKIPIGRAVSYQQIASHLGQPTAARAVGSAVGRNPISFVVPCHRVMRGDGTLGGYHWGLTRKRALIGWETGRKGAVQSSAPAL